MNKRILTFLSIGAFDTLLDALLFTFLIYIFGNKPENVVILNIISYSVVVVCAFILNGKLTFKDERLTKGKFAKFYASSIVALGLNTIIVSVLMIIFNFGTIVSKIISACIVVIYNYVMCKKYIFEDKS